VQAPAEVVAKQAFPVQIGFTSPAAAIGAQTVNLYILDEGAGGRAPMVLSGSLQAPLVNGTAVFPGVVITGESLERPIRLVALVVTATGSISALSGPVVVHAPPEPPATLQDLTVGIVGIDMGIQNGVVTTLKAMDDFPARAAGIEDGDQILVIDGKSTQGFTLLDASNAMSGPPGAKVVLTVRHKSSSETQTITVVRAAYKKTPVQFDSIPNQAEMVPFQVGVTVVDDAGQPLPGATVTVRIDPAKASAHFLFISTKTNLGDSAGLGAEALTAVTGPDGRASLWVRLENATTPFGSRLVATATYKQYTSSLVKSNDFTVYER